MSTQLTDVGDMVMVATVSGPGKRKRTARKGVLVSKDDREAIRAEIIRQADRLRAEMLIPKPEEVLVA